MHRRRYGIGFASLMLLAGCGSDTTLGRGFEQAPPEPTEEVSNLSPISVGQQIWYGLIMQVRRHEASGGGISGEAQAAGHLCLQVDELQDTATEAYADAPQTLVVAGLQASGQNGPEFDFSDQQVASTTAEGVDAMLSPLWLRQLTVPLANHGFEVAKPVVFDTQSTPLPENGIAALPFFEVRKLESQDWSGWRYDETMDGANSYLDGLYRYFGTPDSYKRRDITPRLDCADFDSSMQCPVEGCTWTTPPGGNQSACMSLYTVTVWWRHRLTAPDELIGPVVHQLSLSYTLDGILLRASEAIVPDRWTDGQFPASAECDRKCLSAELINHGVWFSNARSAPCAFSLTDLDSAGGDGSVD